MLSLYWLDSDLYTLKDILYTTMGLFKAVPLNNFGGRKKHSRQTNRVKTNEKGCVELCQEDSCHI